MALNHTNRWRSSPQILTVLQVELGRGLVQRFVGRHVSLVGNRQILRFLSLAGPVACLVNATVGVIAQRAVDLVPYEVTGRAWVTWWVGDTLGVIIFGPLTLMLLPEQREVWRDRRLKVALPALASVAIAIALFLQGAAMSQHQQDAVLKNTADAAASVLTRELAEYYEVLGGVRGFFMASVHVSPAEFGTFTRVALAAHPEIRALSWDVALQADQLPAFVQQHRTIEGLDGFSADGFTATKQAAGGQVPSNYALVAYVEPRATNAAALGFGTASKPARLSAIGRAISSQTFASTAPISLVRGSAQEAGYLVFLPVYKTSPGPALATGSSKGLLGFAVGVFSANDLMQDAFTRTRWRRQSLALTDITDAQNPVPMSTLPSSVSGTPLPTLRRVIPAAGRIWRLDVTTTIHAGAQPQLVTEPSVMVTGLGIAMLLMAFLLLISGLERQARRDANIDPLTGLYNRRALLTRLESARRLPQSNGTSHVLLFLDLDHFKTVNDTAGHGVGDAVLQDIAAILRRGVRESDTVARLGGDEFAIILLDCDAGRGCSIAEKIVQGVRERALHAEGPQVTVGVSVGLTMITAPDPQDVDELLHHADRASYVAKFAGGNRVVQHKSDAVPRI